MSATKKRLPHGTIPFERITDRTVRDTVMKLNENIVALKKMIDELSSITGSAVSGGGAEIDVDDELSLDSTNPVQNRVITEKIVEVDESVESISGRTSTLETGVSQLGNRTLNLETGVSQLGARTSSLEERAETSDGRIDSVENRVDSVEDKIPSQATSLNKLADKDFVNSSISTNTSFFRGTSATGLTETQFLSWANGLTKTNNDYVFWNTVDSDGNIVFKRYKYNGTAWVFEYALNNSSFTAEQWAAIQSGITSSKVSVIDGLDARFNAKANATDVVGLSLPDNNSVIDNFFDSFSNSGSDYDQCAKTAPFDGWVVFGANGGSGGLTGLASDSVTSYIPGDSGYWKCVYIPVLKGRTVVAYKPHNSTEIQFNRIIRARGGNI